MASKMAVTMALELLQELYPGWEQTEITERVWSLALRDLTDQQLESAVGAWITTRTSDYGAKQPLPGDIRKLALESVDRLDWAEAFAEIMDKAYRTFSPICVDGEPVPVEWSSPILPKLLKRLDRDFVLNLKIDDMGTARAQFRQMFAAEEQKAGGVIRREKHLTSAEPQTMTEAQLLEYASDMAERLVSPFRNTLSETEYQEQVLRAAKIIRENKRHKLRETPRALPEPQRETSEGQRQKAARLMARIQKHNPTPQQVISEAVRNWSGN